MADAKFCILIVDDETVVRDSLVHWFTEEGYDVEASESATDALAKLAAREYDLVIADVRVPGMDGMELLGRIKTEELLTGVIIMTGFASAETAVQALQNGVFDYVTKPLDLNELSVVVRNALEQQKLTRENRLLRQQLSESEAVCELMGQSEAMRRVREQIETVAEVDSTVLIEGASGTGKELVAKAIHRLSPRRFNPMVVVHCGARYRKKGKFEAASGGTVFLDEIADISLKTQTDLLRVLQEREIARVGGTPAVNVDFRVIAATNRNLAELVKEGRFRSDLYYRLNVFAIQLPPLANRHGDVPVLATHFLDKYSSQMNRKFSGFDRAALDLLSAYNWPGNVKELENIIERAVVVGREPLIREQDIAITTGEARPEDRSLEAMEGKHILQVLEDFGWNRTHASKALGIDRVTLYHKIRRHGLKAPEKAA